MKSNLAKVSLALLSAVFILGCQDVGTGVVASDGLVPQFAKPDCGTTATHASCKPPDEPIETFTVKVTGAIFSVGTNIYGGEEGLYEAHGPAVKVVDLQLNISSIRTALSCAEGSGLSVLGSVLTGNLVFGNFLIDNIALNFDHNLAQHHFSSHTELPDTWPPLPGETFTVESGSGEWGVQTKGKNHQDGCTGEGVFVNPMPAWTAEVTNITGP